MTAAAVALDHRLARALDAWLPWQRWYAGKGRPHTAVTVVQSTPFSELPDGSVGSILVLRVDFADRGAAEHYQVPVGIRASLPDPVAPYLIAALDDLVVYEATGDHELVTELLGLVAGEHARDPLGFTSFGGFADGPPLSSRPLGVEQTNTSVVVDDRYVVKFFRRLHPGVNPELELPRALAASAGRHTAALHGAVEGHLDGAPVTYAVVQSFLAGAVDGWALAQDSLHRLRTEPWSAVREFAAEAFEMGRAVATVHAELAAGLGTGLLGPAELAGLAATMARQLDESCRVVPELALHRVDLAAAFAEVARLPGGAETQRVHGDLHLGQLLRGPAGWALIDFEGEPSLPMAERAVPHSPLRDVAGMLRSFEYAADHADLLAGPSNPAATARLRIWAEQGADAFCLGYAGVAGWDPRGQDALLRAHTLHKAVYEAHYEARHRPDFLPIPLAAVRRLLAQ